MPWCFGWTRRSIFRGPVRPVARHARQRRLAAAVASRSEGGQEYLYAQLQAQVGSSIVPFCRIQPGQPTYQPVATFHVSSSIMRAWSDAGGQSSPEWHLEFLVSAIMPFRLPCCHGVPCPSPATAHLTHACQLGMPRLQKSMQICQSPKQKASPGISWALICFLSCRV